MTILSSSFTGNILFFASQRLAHRFYWHLIKFLCGIVARSGCIDVARIFLGQVHQVRGSRRVVGTWSPKGRHWLLISGWGAEDWVLAGPLHWKEKGTKSMEKAQYSCVNTIFLCMIPNTLFDKPWMCLFNNDILRIVTQYLLANTLQKPKYPVLTQVDNTEIVCYTKQKHNIFLLTHCKETVFLC